MLLKCWEFLPSDITQSQGFQIVTVWGTDRFVPTTGIILLVLQQYLQRSLPSAAEISSNVILNIEVGTFMIDSKVRIGSKLAKTTPAYEAHL